MSDQPFVPCRQQSCRDVLTRSLALWAAHLLQPISGGNGGHVGGPEARWDEVGAPGLDLLGVAAPPHAQAGSGKRGHPFLKRFSPSLEAEQQIEIATQGSSAIQSFC